MSDAKSPQCVILAGGVASRLGARAGDLPKNLVPVAGRPFADHQLTWLAEQGVSEVLYCIGYRGDQIRGFVEDGHRWGLAVTYVDEGSCLRGTGGALRLALEQHALAREFAVLYGDSYLLLDLPTVFTAFRNSGTPALMTVLKNEDRWGHSNADVEHNLVTSYSKDDRSPNLKWIDYGLSIIAREVVDRIPAGEPADLADLFTELSDEGLLAGFEVKERFYEIGSLEGLNELARLLDSQDR